MTVQFDRASGIVTTTCVGASTEAQQADYLVQLHAAMAAARAASGRFRHLVDQREGVMQVKFGFDRLARKDNPNRQPGDRTAILLRTNSRNLQVDSGAEQGEIRFFDDQDAALAWLLEA